MRRRGLAAPLAASAVILAVVAAAQALVPGPPPLAYDPEAWLVWGRELIDGRLDVSVGPAIKPLPILLDGAAVSLLGGDAARSLWAVIALGGLVGALLLTWQLARRAAGARRLAVAAVAAVLMAAPLVEGGLTGASEPLAFAGLLGAATLLAARRLRASMLVLGAVALLRPEALIVLGAVAASSAIRAGSVRERAAILLGGSAVGASVALLWLGVQWLGGADSASAVRAATALRAGQPGLTAQPSLAALWAAGALLLPAAAWAGVVLLAGGGWGGGSFGGRTRGSSEADLAGVRWLAGLGAAWTFAVVAMSEIGFSGEGRYLAPGVAACGVALVVAAGVRAQRHPRRGDLFVGVATAVLVIGAAATVRGEWSDARRLAASQHELDRLLEQPPVRAASARGDTIAVPRFMRPPTAWRLQRRLVEVQSPSTVGAEAQLVERGGPSPPAPWVRDARAGRWEWWVKRATPAAQTDRSSRN